MEKEYKIEMKPTYWEVIIESGCYSDKTEAHLVFSGNSEEEIWEFLKRYEDDVCIYDNLLCGDCSDGASLAIKWNENTYLSKKFTGNKEDVDWSSDYDIGNIKIKRLNVIYFKS